ncbi:MAG: leucyl aminopeptidase [Patescibacteria group bacterium]
MFQCSSEKLSSHRADAVVFFVLKGKPFLLPAEFKVLDSKMQSWIQAWIRREDFQAEHGELVNLTMPDGGSFHRLLIVGLGEEKSLTIERFRSAVGGASRFFQRHRVATWSVFLPPSGVARWSAEFCAESFTKATLLSLYQFDHYRSEKKRKTFYPEWVTILASRRDHQFLQRGVDAGVIIAEAVHRARDCGNMPSNHLTPQTFAAWAVEMGKLPRVKTTVLDESEIRKLKMGAFLGVSGGSSHPPRFMIVEYRGNAKKKAVSVLVGKAITFDSGGISLKPSESMECMKFDMMGGAAVLGTIQALAKLKAKVNIVGLVPATENMPGSKAYKPGDVLTTMSGKTIEVLNTDAEGRMILSDALIYAKRYHPNFIADIATLTGSCASLLGSEASGVMMRQDDLMSGFQTAAQRSGDRVWQLPLYPEHFEMMKSDIADVKNIGGRTSGAMTAGAFLATFVDEKTPWAHFDIAGTADMSEAKPYISKGATGVGIDFFIQYFRTFHQS